MSSFFRHSATIVAAIAGLFGVLLLLYAWDLPPFDRGIELTEDAYVRGRVTSLAPQISGNIAEVAVQDYQTVQAGEILVRIDDRIPRERLAQSQAMLAQQRAALATSAQDEASAKANIASAEASVVSAGAALDVASANRKRAEALLERGVSTQVDTDQMRLVQEQASAAKAQAEAQAEAMRQGLRSILVNRDALQAAVAGAEASVALAQIDVENSAIRAPVAGRLGEVTARVGQYVTPGTRVATLVPADIWVVANFKETQVAGMYEGQQVALSVDAIPGRRFVGHIERFAPATGSEFSVIRPDNATGNFIKVSQRLPVRIAVAPGQPGAELLTPGLSVVARIDTTQASAAGQPTGL